ncbi:MAG: RluA family pseudouridine synthase, partial [Oscillospiraceae bacterium]|nr:RluA family pseudouridine synthase [Oscillospiraceae bacterium]
RTLSHTVGAERDGQPLRNVLRGELRLSYSLLKSLKWRENAILLNGVPAHVDALVHTGDAVTVALSERREAAEPSGGVIALDVVYEDEDILVINKPANVAMHPRRGAPGAADIASSLARRLGDGSAAHFVSRLDKGTSGLFIAAKTGYVHDRLRVALHTDALRREYRAVAIGRPDPADGVVDLPIGRADGSIVKRRVCADGLPSVTEYHTLAYDGAFSLLRLVPKTGRTHQLRVHMAALGCPLAGDWLYGTEDLSLIARPALHSYELWFTQPVTGEKLHFTAPLPDDMAHLAGKMCL